MRALVLAVLVCCIVALFLVAGCTFNLKNADGSLNKSFSTNPGTGADTGNSAGIGGGTGAGKSSGNPVQKPYASTKKSEKGYQFYLNYIYTDKTDYPRYDNLQTCGPCDTIKSEKITDESHNELVMQGYVEAIGGYTVTPSTDPRVLMSGNNYQRKYDWMENYVPADDGKNGCQGRGQYYRSGYTYETLISGKCDKFYVDIPSPDDKDLHLVVEPTASGCKSTETITKKYKGTTMPDSADTSVTDSQGDYHFVCAPYQKGYVRSDETDEYFFGKGAGEQTTRDFYVDTSNVYHIRCSGSKDEVLLPGCTGCSRQNCWPGGAATRHRERILDIAISPADVPLPSMPTTTMKTTATTEEEPLVSLEPLEPLVPNK